MCSPVPPFIVIQIHNFLFTFVQIVFGLCQNSQKYELNIDKVNKQFAFVVNNVKKDLTNNINCCKILNSEIRVFFGG